ncbi:hypothetical protein WOC18_25225, partial [Vibrio parahaemolyticus]
MKKLTVIFSFIILSSFVGYIFIYKPHADQMQLEAVVVNLEADDRLRKLAITDLKEIADSGHAVAQAHIVTFILNRLREFLLKKLAFFYFFFSVKLPTNPYLV